MEELKPVTNFEELEELLTTINKNIAKVKEVLEPHVQERIVFLDVERHKEFHTEKAPFVLEKETVLDIVAKVNNLCIETKLNFIPKAPMVFDPRVPFSWIEDDPQKFQEEFLEQLTYLFEEIREYSRGKIQ